MTTPPEVPDDCCNRNVVPRDPSRQANAGVGAAMTLPAALSIVATSFKEGKDRNTALGVWGGMAGLASAVGVLLGGLLTEGPGWRWVMFVNTIAVVLVSRGGGPCRGQPGAGALLLPGTPGLRLAVAELARKKG
jgi:MFS family permease